VSVLGFSGRHGAIIIAPSSHLFLDGAMTVRPCAVEHRQKALDLVETPEDLVETLLNGGQARRHGGVVRAWDRAAGTRGVVHDGAFLWADDAGGLVTCGDGCASLEINMSSA
jgi:hypothetical protein